MMAAAALIWVVPSGNGMDSQTDAAVTQLAGKLHQGADANRSAPVQILGPILYQLWSATRNDLSPESAVSMAAQRVQPPLNVSTRDQLLADWRVASRYGLLTPDNLSRLQRGTPPVATDGRFVGQTMDVAQIHPGRFAMDLVNLAFRPSGQSISDEALAPPARLALFSGVQHVGSLQPYRPAVVTPTTLPQSRELPPGRIEFHDVPFNGSLPLGGTRKLAVASDSGSVLSVSVIGDGPKVHRVANVPFGSVEADYPRVDNAKVPKANPIRLPGVDGNAYLIHTEPDARFYFIDTIVNNGAAFRIATVPLYP